MMILICNDSTHPIKVRFDQWREPVQVDSMVRYEGSTSMECVLPTVEGATEWCRWYSFEGGEQWVNVRAWGCGCCDVKKD